MRTFTQVMLTPTAAEQLLDGGDGPADLRRLLNVAAGPGTASELAGEAAAVAAFVEATSAAPLPGHPSRSPSMYTKILSKIPAARTLAVLALAASTTGGVALAANSTFAPVEVPAASAPADAPRSAPSGPPTSADAPADAPIVVVPSEAPESDQPDKPADSGERDGRPDAHPTASPQPSMAGLCQAWTAEVSVNPGKARENPAFTVLINTAGGADGVPNYCADLPADTAPGKSGEAPGQLGTAPGLSDAVPSLSDAVPGSQSGHPNGAPGAGGDQQGKANQDGEQGSDKSDS